MGKLDDRPIPRHCEAAGCDAEGRFPAPWSRAELRRRRWFCLDHIRLYNAAWDYLDGLDEENIEALVRDDACWQQPTWPLGAASGPANGQGQESALRAAARRARFGEGAPSASDALAPEPRPGEEEVWARAVLEVSPRADFALAKSRYKELVKRLHPDLNGGHTGGRGTAQAREPGLRHLEVPSSWRQVLCLSAVGRAADLCVRALLPA